MSNLFGKRIVIESRLKNLSRVAYYKASISQKNSYASMLAYIVQLLEEETEP